MVTDYRRPPGFFGTEVAERPLMGDQSGTVSLRPRTRLYLSSYGRPALTYPDLLKQLFQVLTRQWKEDTGLVSSPTRIAMHPAYQRIIGMGESAVPFILEDLALHGGDWYWALHAITGAAPVAPNLRHTSREVRDIWLRWGRERGYID